MIMKISKKTNGAVAPRFLKHYGLILTIVCYARSLSRIWLQPYEP